MTPSEKKQDGSRCSTGFLLMAYTPPRLHSFAHLFSFLSCEMMNAAHSTIPG